MMTKTMTTMITVTEGNRGSEVMMMMMTMTIIINNNDNDGNKS